MAQVRVRIDDLERGDLPALSVKTGAACANPVAVVFRPEQRPWSLRGPKIRAIVPLEASRAQARRSLTRISWAILVLCAAALVASYTGAGAVALLAAAAAFVAYFTVILVGDVRWIGSRPSEVGGEIVVTRVHRAFADAVDRQYDR